MGAAALSAVIVCVSSEAADVIRRPLSEHVVANLLSGQRLGVEVELGGGEGAQRVLQPLLAIESEWVAYRGRVRVFVPADRLKPETRRQVLMALYPNDTVDERGWLHVVSYPGETLFSLAEWITGSGHNHERVLDADGTSLKSASLNLGQRILFPKDFLSPAMARPSEPVVAKSEAQEAMPEKSVAAKEETRAAEPERVAEASSRDEASGRDDETLLVSPALDGQLAYGSDRQGDFAVYHLERGEALFTSVVVRFTDYRENADILEACKVIARRSGIPDVRDIDAGKKILIPLEMLSDRFKPDTSPDKKAYLASLEESERLRITAVRSKDLSDVVVILDPGHGGGDHGAYHTASGLYEDEINYDIVCRIRQLLESETGAKVYVTVADKSEGFKPSQATRFVHDRDEVLLTDPPYNLDNARVGVNLRYMLANSIYDKEIKRGVDSRKIIFTSIHTDSLFNQQLRGTMVYIPGARWRRDEETRSDAVYARYAEGRAFNRFTSTSSERRRDEALSRNFAIVLLDELGAKKIKRHDKGDPIRSQINRSKDTPMVPGVIRNTDVPTKVLVETANLMNATDRERLADPWWRQQFAHAYVDALKRYFAGPADGASNLGVEAD